MKSTSHLKPRWMIIRVSHIFTVIDAYDRCFENHLAGTGPRRDSLLSACCEGVVSARLDVGSNVCENIGGATNEKSQFKHLQHLTSNFNQQRNLIRRYYYNRIIITYDINLRIYDINKYDMIS